MSSSAFHSRLTGETWRSLSPAALLGGAVIGVYAVVVAGIAVSVTGAGETCSGQVDCLAGSNLATLDTLLVAGHHLAAFLVGLLLAVVLIRLRGADVPPHVTRVSAVSALLYPIQAVIGMQFALLGTVPALQYLHLALGMGIFSLLFVGLLWALDRSPAADSTESHTGASGYETSDVREENPAGQQDESNRSPAVTSGHDGNLTVRDRVQAYISLTKPRLMWLLSLVALAGMALAVPSLSALDPVVVGATLVGGALAIGASGTFNNVIERNRDERMDRTDGRPLVTGDISPVRATVFGVLLSLTSIAVFLVFTNALAATLTVLAILFYTVGYTVFLKPNTTANITIGGIVGAFPALIGWAAVTETVGLPALLLGVVIVLWTPAHFYPLAIAYVDDYADAEFPMLPVVHGERVTRRRTHFYAGATMVAVAGFVSVGPVGALVTLTTIVLAAVFVGALFAFHRSRDRTTAFRTFLVSNFYLGVFLIAIVLEATLP